MTEKTYATPLGTIHYWVSKAEAGAPPLVFLPGLTADHRLFEKQTEYFEGQCTVLVWDAPGHSASRPFTLSFTLADKARWLHEILASEGIERPVFIGQSMGGYVSQCYMELYPRSLSGFVSVDSAPLQRKYVTAAEIWLLRRMTPVYRAYPWKQLVNAGSNGVAVSAHGKQLMRDMMGDYSSEEYSVLAGHGYKMLADAMDADLPYKIDCPCLLLCGEDDRAGSTKRYNRRWTREAGLPIVWLKGAGHNSNTDVPDEVNRLIEQFARNKAATSVF